MNTIKILKTLPDRWLPGAGTGRGIILRWALSLLLLAMASVTAPAAPVVSKNGGYFLDEYADNLGIFSASRVRVAGGTVSLIPPNTTGNYVTVEIVPTSFDQWKQLEVTPGSYGALGDLTATVLSEDGLTVLIAAQPVNGPISLASLNSPTLVPGIRVQINFTGSGVVAPTVDSLLVTWNPVSQLLLDKQGPAEVQAGENIVYRLRYSANYVHALGLVVWDTLPHYANSSLVYPAEISPTPYPGQSDNVKFVSATKGGLFHAGPAPLVVDGVIIPTNSVYWRLGNVDEGVTDLLNFTVATRDGTLSGTILTNHAFAAAANAAPSQSPAIITTIHSEPKPSAGVDSDLCFIGGALRTLPGQINTFNVSAGNSRFGTDDETMYRTVLYDDLTGLLGVIDDQGTPLVLADDFFSISAGGTFVPNYTPPGSAVSFPAIVWPFVTLEPGAVFSGSFSVRLKAVLAQSQYTHRACVISDQTVPACGELTVKIGVDETLDIPLGKIAPPSVPHGGNAVFRLHGGNKSAVTVNDLLFVDRVPTNTTFRSAWFDNPALAASGAVIFYSTSIILPQDWNNPPPADFTQAPGDLDVGPNAHWARYDLNPPANPEAVTWVAFYFPRVDPNCRPDAATPPTPPLLSVDGFFDVTVFTPPDPCADDVVDNLALFTVNSMTSSGGTKVPLSGGPLHSASQTRTVVEGIKARVSADSGITPRLVVLPGSSTYSLTVGNIGTDTLGNVQAVVQLSQMSINGVLQYPSVQGYSPAATYDAAGRFIFALGLLGPGVSRAIEVQMDFPAGILDETEYTVAATVTGQGVLCGPATTSTSSRGQVQSSPKLKVFKNDIVDLILSGAAYDYELEYVNLGTAPSTGTFVVDRVPNRTVLVRAYGNPTITRVWFSGVNNLPPQAVTPLTQITGGTIASQFSAGIFHDNGTPLNPADDYWTSPFGEQTYWVAWEVDDPTLNPPQLLLNTPRTVGFTVRNDDDAQGAGTAGSPEGTLLFNTALIFSSELLQAIGNQVITTVKEQPSIIVQKSGPSVIEAGMDFNWVVTYYNNSLTPAQSVVVTDTLPPGIIFLGATHTWNAQTTGTPPNNNNQFVPTSTVLNGNGSTTLTFVIAGVTGYRGGPLGSLEGGQLTLAVRADPATASGTVRVNAACGTADTAGDSITSCDEHQITIFRPDLQLLKHASPATVLAGGTMTYQLVVANRGPINARDVALTDVLPAGVSYVSGSLSVVTPGYTLGVPSISGQTLTWSAAHGNALTRTGLPAGEVPGVSGNILIQFDVVVGVGVPGCTTLNNCAQVSTVSAEEGVYANVACASATVPPPELAVAKSGQALALPGNRISWDIAWVNSSLQSAAGVYLVDTLPNNDADANSDVTFVSVTAPGATPYYHAGPVTPVPIFDPVNPLAGGWSAAPTTPVNHIALLVGALAGNTGPFTAQVTVDLIDPITHILPAPGSSFANTVVIAQAVPLCEDAADNTATAVVRTPALDLALTKTGSVQGSLPGIAPGKPITYTLAFENSGTVKAYGVRITDTIPATLVPSSPLDNFTVVALVDGLGNPVNPVDQLGVPIVGAVPVTRVISGPVVTWYLGTTTPSDALYYQKVGLLPGSRGSFELRATVAQSVADDTQVCNPATVAADVGTEEVLANNSSQSCVIVRRADVAVRKFGVELASGDPNFAEFGGLIRYTIEYNNLGSLSAQNVVINEIVPDNTRLVSVNPPPGATVTYSPNQANATSFSVSFATLPVPANSVGVTAPDNTVIIDCANPTNCCADCFTNVVSQSVTVIQGNNFLSVPLCLGASNNLNTILTNGERGMIFQKWNTNAQGFTVFYNFFTVADGAPADGWYNVDDGTLSTETLVPGEGFALFKGTPGTVTFTFTGCLPTCTPPCGPIPSGPFPIFSLVGKRGLGSATYADLFSCAPACGTQVRVWSPINQVFNDYNYVNGVWTPEAPVVPAGASAFVAVLANTNCLPCNPTTDCFTNAVSQSVTITNGLNFLSVPLCLGASNDVNTILPSVPSGTRLFKWNRNTQTFTTIHWVTVAEGVPADGWYDGNGTLSTETLVLGEGFALSKDTPGTSTITFTGCLPTGQAPCRPLPVFSLVGKLGLGSATYADLFSCAPVCGTQVRIWSPINQVFNDYNYVNGVWTPQVPVVPAGASAFVALLANTNCLPCIPTTNVTAGCLGVNSNGVYEASALANPSGFLKWGTLFVDDIRPNGAHITYSVGRKVGATAVYDLGPLYTSVSVGPNGLDLSGINPAYTNLVLRAEFSSVNGSNSPCLKAWQMTYDSANWPSFTFTVRVNDDSCGGPLPINNVVSISTITPEITLANNTTNYSMNTRLTDLHVRMSVNKAAALIGATLDYTLTWSVLGPRFAPHTYLQVVLADGNYNDASADVTFNTFTTVPALPVVAAYYHTAPTLTPPLFDPLTPGANDWSSDPAGANHVAFLLGDLAPNSTGSITFSAIIKTGTAGRTLLSTVTGHTARRDTVCDNTDSALTFVGNLANVHVQKTGPGCVHPGDLLTFTIRYGNNGNLAAANVVVNDLMPAGLTFDSAVPAPTGPGLTWNNLGATPGTLAVNETGVITVMARLDNNYALVDQELENLATISTSNDEVDLTDNRDGALLDCIKADVTSLNGYVYHDRDNDGVREFAESGIPDVTVTLTGTNVFGDSVLLTAVTDRNGAYSFPGLNPGTYTLIETQPATWASASDTLGTVNGVVGSNPSQFDNLLAAITLNGGANGVEYNFGENYLGLGNLVWRDDNNNGQQDAGEPGISGVTLQLWSPGTNGVIGGGDDQLLESTSTSAGGFYQFTHLLPGNYYVLIPLNNFTAGGNLQNVPLSSTPTILTDSGAAGPDNRDVGNQSGGTGTETVSPVVNLALGQEAPDGVDGNDFNGMLTLDFGFLCAQAPSITCPPPIAVSCAAEVPAPNPASVPAGAACASCGTGMNVIWAGDVMSASNCVNRFVITRTYRATDGCGNSATCRQLITVNDTTPPVISCPPNGRVCQLQLFCGYTQGGWGAAPSGNNPAMILRNNFAFVYRSGFVEIGIPGSGGYSIKLTSAAAIEAYLPSGQTAGAFTKDVTNPTLTTAGVFGGQVLALQLNVDFNDAGVIGGSTGNLGDIVLNDPASPLNGRTVRQILAIANTALGGGNVSSYGVTINALNALVDSLNQAFDNCQASAWAATHLSIPTPPSVDGGTATAVDNCNDQPTITYSDSVTHADVAGNYTIRRTWRAVDACGNSSVCDQTLSFQGRPPVGLTAAVASASVTLRWNPSPGATGYNVKRSTNSGGPYTVIATGIVTTNYTDTTVVNGTVYYYVFSALKPGAETCNSMQIMAIPFAPLPSPWKTKDIGTVAATGGASYAASKFTVIGSGADIGGTDDEFRWVYQTASGDCSLIARVPSLRNTDPWAKAGVMIRESLNSNAKQASTFITSAHGVTFRYRAASGGNSAEVNTTGLVAPYWLKVARVGNTLTSFVSPNGTTWTTIGSQTIPMGTSVYMGLGVTSRNDGTLCPAVFENVTATP